MVTRQRSASSRGVSHLAATDANTPGKSASKKGGDKKRISFGTPVVHKFDTNSPARRCPCLARNPPPRALPDVAPPPCTGDAPRPMMLTSTPRSKTRVE